MTLLVPTLNEFGGMRQIMPRIKKEWLDQIIVLDGGSTDHTVEYAKENGYTVVIQKRKGLRNGYIEAFEHVEGDVVITFSPDGNCIPELIPELIAKMKDGYDMVVVSRYLGNAKSYDDDVITAFGNRMFTFLIGLFFRTRYTDAMGIFRAYKTKLFEELDMDKDISYSREERLFRTMIGVEPLLSIRAAKRKLKIAEIPGDEPPRLDGIRKLQTFKWGAAYLAQVFREIFFWR